LAVCADATCTSKTITLVDSAGDVGNYYSSVALNSSGFPVISYVDLTNFDLKLAVCADLVCTSKTITVVDSAGNVGYYPSMKLNSSGFPVISYMDGTNGWLKLATCTNATCTTKTFTTVDTVYGAYSSLLFNSSGFPVISYHNASTGGLKLAICNDATCSTKTLTTVDSNSNVGTYSSLQLNASGFPVISYRDANFGGGLKIAVCSNVTCSAKTLFIADSTGNTGYSISSKLRADGTLFASYYNLSTMDSSSMSMISLHRPIHLLRQAQRRTRARQRLHSRHRIHQPPR
jgi:hypothetical protein